MDATKVILEVTAGILRGEPMPEYTKQWSLSWDEYNDLDAQLRALGHASLYTTSLQNPVYVNWVRYEWLYL